MIDMVFKWFILKKKKNTITEQETHEKSRSCLVHSTFR